MNSIQAETKRVVSMINSARSRTTAHGIAQSVAGRIAAAAIAEREFKLGLEAVYTAYELGGVVFTDTRSEALEKKRAILTKLEAASGKTTLAPACAGGSLPSQVPQTLKNDSGHLPATGSVISPAAAVPSKPAAQGAAALTDAELNSLCCAVLGTATVSERASRLEMRTKLWQEHLTLPGDDFADIVASGAWRKAELKGMERATKSLRQDRINSFFKAKSTVKK